jgi:hypothetical protein
MPSTMRRPIEQTYRPLSIMKIPQLSQSLNEESFTKPYVDLENNLQLLARFGGDPRENGHNDAT